MKDFVFIKDCSTCSHKTVCKFKDQYESTTAAMQNDLKTIVYRVNDIPDEIIEVSIRCKLYSAEYQIGYSGNPIFNPPIVNPPYDTPSPSFDPYKITFAEQQEDTLNQY